MTNSHVTATSTVKIYSVDDHDAHVSIAAVTGIDETHEFILVFPAFSERSMLFKHNETHKRYEHWNIEGETYYFNYEASPIIQTQSQIEHNQARQC